VFFWREGRWRVYFGFGIWGWGFLWFELMGEGEKGTFVGEGEEIGFVRWG
jgi:hypothetical protein